MREMLNIGRSTCLKLLSSKEIKSVRIGRVYKIPKVNIIEYLNRKQND
ncbi:MAG: helix-turn-helix domain-containing protein [Oscillospiraceae bacterium]